MSVAMKFHVMLQSLAEQILGLAVGRFLTTVCFTVNLCLFAGCTSASETGIKIMPQTIIREFKLKSGTILIDEAELEAIRKSVMEKLASGNDDVHRALRLELSESIAIVGPADSRLGPWALTERDDRLALVRIPPRRAMNYIFVAKLSREKSHWIVTEFFQERMKAK